MVARSVPKLAPVPPLGNERKVVRVATAVAEQERSMGAIHKMGVIASLLLMVHATLCAIQRAPPCRACLLSVAAHL